MKSSNQAEAGNVSVAQRYRDEIQRAFQRTVKGVDYLTAPKPPVGVTPKRILHRRGTQRVLHYVAQSEELYRIPVLLVMAPSNHGYGMDMQPGLSLVEYLLKAGFDVYMLDWLPPGADESKLTFDDYVLNFIPDAVDRVLRESGESQISLVGYCAAGVMVSCYAALVSDDGPLANLVCFTTPVDFEHLTLHRNLADPNYFNVDLYVDVNGNVPGEAFLMGASMLRPVTRIAEQIRLWDNMWDEKYVTHFRRFDGWASDTLPLPGGYMRQLVTELLAENRLLKNKFSLGGRPVLLGNIKVPFLHVIAEHDHLVPRGASKPLIEMVGSQDKEELILKGGHLSVVTGPNAPRRLWPKLEAWLGSRSE